MKHKHPFKNYGVLIGEKSTDFHAGLVSGNLPYEVRNPEGSYELWLPPGEWQNNDGGDSLSCVSFGAINAIETEELRQTGAQINYSDRWIAKMSGTTKNGNYLYKVLDTIRAHGLVREESYPRPVDKWNWDTYHADIPEPLLSRLKAEGREWLKKWEVQYEWVSISPASLTKHLKHGPLIVVVPGHLVMNYRVVGSIKKIYDSYSPFKKDVPGRYPDITHAMKIVLTPKNLVHPDTLYTDLKLGDWGPSVAKLLRALRALGWGVGESEGWGDAYDEKVQELVLNFQKANLPRTEWPFYWHMFYYRGSLVDQATREAVNSALKSRHS